MKRVNTDIRPFGMKIVDNGSQTLAFDLVGNRSRGDIAGDGTDINKIGTRAKQRLSVSDSRLRIKIFSSIGETIIGNIENTNPTHGLSCKTTDFARFLCIFAHLKTEKKQ